MAVQLSPRTTCHNCGGQNLKLARSINYFMPAAEETEDGLNPLPSHGLPVTPIICHDCGYVHLVLARELLDKQDSND